MHKQVKTQTSKLLPNTSMTQRKSSVAPVPVFEDHRPESAVQLKLAGLMNTRQPLQMKNRIDLDKVESEKKAEINGKVEALKQERRDAKKEATRRWASSDGKDEGRDTLYNQEIEEIRKTYEQKIIDLAKEYGIDPALISGEAYYGKEVEEDGLKFHRRPDSGKE